MHKTFKIITLIGIQTLLGKRASFPYGVMAGLDLVEITLWVIANDIAQTLILLHFFERLAGKIDFLKKRKDQYANRDDNRRNSRRRERLMKWKDAGIFAISALPYGGGALTGSLLAITNHIDKSRAFFLIVSGCILGSFIFWAGFSGISAIFF